MENSSSIKPAFSRDFPQNFSILNAPFKYPTSFHHYQRDYPPGCGPNASRTIKIDPKNRSNNDPSLTWKRLLAAMEKNPPLNNNNNNGGFTNNPQTQTPIEVKKPQNTEEFDPKISSEREKVVEKLRVFRKKCTEIARSGKGIRRIDTTAYNEMKNEGRFLNHSAFKVGEVPGVEIGDKFHYRVELSIVGLHKHFERGIDSMEWKGGRIATCIVASERHLDKMSDPNVLTYIGEGGVLKRNEVGVPPDQELKAGNRALWSSMKEKLPVRVVRGLVRGAKVLYVYDGVYDVVGCEKKKGVLGNMIFEFKLVRRAGQAAVGWSECRVYKF